MTRHVNTLKEEKARPCNDVVENLPSQEEIHAPAMVKHFITEDTNEGKEANHQDDSCLFPNFLICSDDIM